MNKKKQGQVGSPPEKLSRSRIMLFKLISVLTAFLILFLLEVSLRLFHYGHDLSLFIDDKADKNFLVLNPDASRKYFGNQAIATRGNAELFKKKKDKNTLRFFVLGESTTIGYPYFHNGSFHRWLQYRLMHTFPDRNFEIINIGLTAVNSYTVLGFAKEVVNYEPDAVLIYTGHNEYYGAMGVGSTDKITGNAFMIGLILKLRELRVMQLLVSMYDGIRGIFGNGSSDAGKNRMEMMVAEQRIPYGSALFNRGINQFRNNINKTLELFNNRRIPVFISDLVSNEKDLEPFTSEQADSIQFPTFNKYYDAGLKAFRANDPGNAETDLKRADSVYNGNAHCNYFLGRIAFNRGDQQQAERRFSNARDLDLLRFRAPGEMNTIIHQLCDKYKYAHLVNTKAAFDSVSGGHIIGNELLLEHVHPNLRGYALMSDAFYQSMKKEIVFAIDKEKEMDLDQLMRDMPVTVVDSLAGVYKVVNLKKSHLFSETLPADAVNIQSEEEKIAYALAFNQIPWYDAMENLYNYYMTNKDLAKARVVLEGSVLETPYDAGFYEKTAMVCNAMKDIDNALFYFKRSFELAPDFDKAKNLFVTYLQHDRPSEAMDYLDYAINNNTSSANFIPLKQFAANIILLKAQYAKDSSNLSLPNKIAAQYLRMSNNEGALKYLNIVLKADSRNAEALSLLLRVRKT